MRNGDPEDRRRIRIGPTLAISSSFLILAVTVVYYAGGAEQRLKGVEGAMVEVRSDVRDLTRTVARIEIRGAAMDRRNGITEEPVADRRPR